MWICHILFVIAFIYYCILCQHAVSACFSIPASRIASNVTSIKSLAWGSSWFAWWAVNLKKLASNLLKQSRKPKRLGAGAFLHLFSTGVVMSEPWSKLAWNSAMLADFGNLPEIPLITITFSAGYDDAYTLLYAFWSDLSVDVLVPTGGRHSGLYPTHEVSLEDILGMLKVWQMYEWTRQIYILRPHRLQLCLIKTFGCQWTEKLSAITRNISWEGRIYNS